MNKKICPICGKEYIVGCIRKEGLVIPNMCYDCYNAREKERKQELEHK